MPPVSLVVWLELGAETATSPRRPAAGRRALASPPAGMSVPVSWRLMWVILSLACAYASAANYLRSAPRTLPRFLTFAREPPTKQSILTLITWSRCTRPRLWLAGAWRLKGDFSPPSRHRSPRLGVPTRRGVCAGLWRLMWVILSLACAYATAANYLRSAPRTLPRFLTFAREPPTKKVSPPARPELIASFPEACWRLS